MPIYREHRDLLGTNAAITLIFVINRSVDVIFLLDICVQFFTMYEGFAVPNGSNGKKVLLIAFVLPGSVGADFSSPIFSRLRVARST